MKLSSSVGAVLVVSALLIAPTPVLGQRVSVLPPSGQWVTDQADMLSATDEERLTQRLSEYAQETSTQIIIVTVVNLRGVEIADYAIELGRVWQVGQAEHDNGAVILVAKDDRKVFIATGYGLEGAIPDALAGRIVRQIITPHFKQGQFYEGLAGAVDAMTAAASGEYQADQLVASSPDPNRRGRIVFVIILLIWILILVMIVRAALRAMNGDDRDDGDDDAARRRRRRRRSRWSSGSNVIVWGSSGGWGSSSGSSSGGFSSGGSSSGGFSGGGGSFGGGGAGGSW